MGDNNAVLNYLYELLEFLVPEYVKEGKLHLVIAIGCTRHRSVAIANEIEAFLKDRVILFQLSTEILQSGL